MKKENGELKSGRTRNESSEKLRAFPFIRFVARIMRKRSKGKNIGKVRSGGWGAGTVWQGGKRKEQERRGMKK